MIPTILHSKLENKGQRQSMIPQYFTVNKRIKDKDNQWSPQYYTVN
jgi:hypothetical protein